jgi:exopolysaccharide biosynthesis WecB/TagA/CpsF family protein
MLRSFDVVTPDGQPIRWAMNQLGRAGLRERVYGPSLMLRLCEAAAREGVAVALYGSYDFVLAKLKANLENSIPGLDIAFAEPSVFRPLTEEEDRDLVYRLRKSGCGLVFVGLGCPLQERWVYEHRGRIDAPLIAVGAAFDFHAGNKRQAPAWMQRYGLEWLFRLASEPRRLWKRYLVYNSLFLWFVSGQVIRQALGTTRSRATSVAKRV